MSQNRKTIYFKIIFLLFCGSLLVLSLSNITFAKTQNKECQKSKQLMFRSNPIIKLYRKINGENNSIFSPDGKIRIYFILDNGVPKYSVEYNSKTILNPSRLGFKFQNQNTMVDNFVIEDTSITPFDETWTPVWGQFSKIRNHYNQLVIKLIENMSPYRKMHLTFRVYNDGVGFRYELPSQPSLEYFEITSEETYFEFTDDHRAWWIPADWNSYEHLYQNTPLSDAAVSSVNTPITLKTSEGLYLSVHEAALTDWAGMTLKKPLGEGNYTFKTDLVPWYGTNIKIMASTPHKSPWRTIQIASRAGGLIESNLILNLNDPCVIEDTSWIKPMKYMGIWWGMHRGLWTWEEGPTHGATTQRAKDYIDACVDLNCEGLLVEGWNEGWRNVWGNQNFTKPTDDYKIEEVVSYAYLKGVDIIGHIETGGNITNFENQGIEEVFDYFNQLGMKAVKTGYAGIWALDCVCLTSEGSQYHHGQWMVNHYRRVLESAAAHYIMVDVHEPIKPTGIARTYPNMMSREGVRGQEYNAWGNPPNPPEHLTILPFTRGLAGPVDYTPGVFDFILPTYNKFSTLAHQLALYVILHSPLQMICDLKENYYINEELRPECEFIRNVPVNWDETVALNCEIGDYVTIIRRKGDKWYIGCITDENSRTLDISLSFLDPNEIYSAHVYSDASDADYKSNPTATKLISFTVDNNGTITAELQRGGGMAVELIPTGLHSEITRVGFFGFEVWIVLLSLPLLLMIKRTFLKK